VLSQYAEPRYGLGLLEGGAEGHAYLLKEHIRDPAEAHGGDRGRCPRWSLIDPHMVHLLMAAGERRGSTLAQLTAREGEVLAQVAQARATPRSPSRSFSPSAPSRSTSGRSSCA
jgi:hypothetical protein